MKQDIIDEREKDDYYIYNDCDHCKNKKYLRECDNELIWSRRCEKTVCIACTISCERCYKTETCPFCNVVCDKCHKNICYRCEEKRDEGFGRCSDCWTHTPLCRFCDYTDANYECERCYTPVCNDHKKRCFHCGMKCMECHENYGNCEYCINDISPDDVNEPGDEGGEDEEASQ